MAWIKRNLFFFIAGVLALGLIGAGGWYFYTAYSTEGQTAGKINEDYDTLRQLNQENPQPGKPGGPIDNVAAAKEQQATLRGWIASTSNYFKPVPHLANLQTFPTELDNSIAQLQREAREDGVILPTGYYFTFQAQKTMLAIPQNVLPQLAARLAEIKVICGLLFDARINSLESIRREALSNDDTNGPDYLAAGQATVSTPLAEMTPYEITFNCFSGELASVLGNFASSPYGLVVKSMQIEPADLGGGMPGAMPGAMGNPNPYQNPYGGGAPPAMGGHFNPGGYPPPGPPQRAVPAPPPANGKPVKFLPENRLRIILMVEVVKPKAGK
jgi:hypothetical protein